MIKSPIVAVMLAASAIAPAVAGTDDRHVCTAPVTVIAGGSDVAGHAADAVLAGIGGIALERSGNPILKSSNGKLETVIERLARPRGVLADANGDVYVSDTLHNRIIRACSNAPHTTPTAKRGPF